MFRPSFVSVALTFGLAFMTAAAPASQILGCNAASRTNVDCADIFGGTQTDQGVNFFTDTDYHVGYRTGVSQSPAFMANAMTVTHFDVFATSFDALGATAVDGNTMVVEFDAASALSGMVLSGLSTFSDPRDPNTAVMTETAQVVAYNAQGEKIFDQMVEGENSYVYVDFGNISPMIQTLFISSGGGLPGLTSTNTNVAYLITPLPEPGTAALGVLGLILLAAGRYASRRRG